MIRRDAMIAAAALILALALAIAGGGCSSSSTGPEEITVLWQDDFDGPAGQLPDAAKWRFDVGTGWGNEQLEWDTDRPENVSLDGDGNLAIVAREEQFENCDYTSGRITTYGLFAHTHGRFEARIKLPVGQGLWPAFWMLGNDYKTAIWPACGEIDILEYRGQEPNNIIGSLHGPGYSGATPITGHFVLPGDGFDQAFHVFAIEWDEDGISWLVDNVVYQRRSPADLPSGSACTCSASPARPGL